MPNLAATSVDQNESEPILAKEYNYRDWRDIMKNQKESLHSLISLGVLNAPMEKPSQTQPHLLIQGSQETHKVGSGSFAAETPTKINSNFSFQQKTDEGMASMMDETTSANDKMNKTANQNYTMRQMTLSQRMNRKENVRNSATARTSNRRATVDPNTDFIFTKRES